MEAWVSSIWMRIVGITIVMNTNPNQSVNPMNSMIIILNLKLQLYELLTIIIYNNNLQ